MTRLLLCLLFIGASFTTMASADGADDEAVLKDRKQIEGRWRFVTLVVNGSEVPEEDRKKLTVVNGSDGTWSLLSEGDVISKGTSSIDPTKTPKTIDFIVTEGKGEGNQHSGIYELGGTTRKMCFAPPSEKRPTEFTSTPGSKQVCIKFERKAEPPKQDQKVDRKHVPVQIPEPLRIEHKHLHRQLEKAVESGGKTGEAAKTVAKRMAPHFKREEKIAMPPLGLLSSLRQGTATKEEMRQILPLTEKLQEELPEMLKEHHARMEEEVLYPAAILVGEYIKLKLVAP